MTGKARCAMPISSARSFAPSCLDARISDERISLKYGLIGQETNGLGGFANACRTIPIALEIAADMERLCPDAWLLNFTNPSGMVTEAILRHSRIKAVGLCNVPVIMQKGITTLLQCADEKEVVMQVAKPEPLYLRAPDPAQR